MRPRALNVHSRSSLYPVPLPSLEEHHAVSLILNYILAKPFHVDPLEPLLPNLKRIFALGILKQIKKFFVINLEERAVESNRQALSLDRFENIRNTSWNDALFIWRLGS